MSAELRGTRCYVAQSAKLKGRLYRLSAGELDTYVPGCCSVDQTPQLEGAAICRCFSTAELPEECDDESYAYGADLCVDFVDPPPPPGASSGCAAAPAPSGAIGSLLFLLVAALLQTRRRERWD